MCKNMCKFGQFLQIYFSLPRVWGKVKLYRAKWIYQKKDKDITNLIS